MSNSFTLMVELAGSNMCLFYLHLLSEKGLKEDENSITPRPFSFLLPPPLATGILAISNKTKFLFPSYLRVKLSPLMRFFPQLFSEQVF